MPTEVSVTVDPDGTGDYTSLSAAITGEATDLVAADEYLVIDCISSSGTADTTAVDVTGFTTDKDHFVVIRQGDSDRHLGAWDATNYRLAASSTSHLLTISDPYVIIDGLQIDQTQTNSSDHDIIYVDDVVESTIRNCLLIGNGGSSGVTGRTGVFINADTSSQTHYFYNNIIFARDGVTFEQQAAGESSDFICYQNGILSSEFSQNNRRGIYLNERFGTLSAYVKNCYLVNFYFGGGDDYLNSGATVTTADIMTTDSTSPTGQTSQQPSWVDVFGLDFNLTNTETDPIDTGTDLSSDASGKLDIVADAQGAQYGAGSGYEIGPLEYNTSSGIVENVWQPLTATASVQAPTIGSTASESYSASVLTATASLQAPTVSQETLGPVTFYNALPW